MKVHNARLFFPFVETSLCRRLDSHSGKHLPALKPKTASPTILSGRRLLPNLKPRSPSSRWSNGVRRRVAWAKVCIFLSTAAVGSAFFLKLVITRLLAVAMADTREESRASSHSTTPDSTPSFKQYPAHTHQNHTLCMCGDETIHRRSCDAVNEAEMTPPKRSSSGEQVSSAVALAV